MQVSVSAAKAQLTDLVRRAEAGDEIVLTRHGQPAVRLVPAAGATGTERKPTREEKWQLLEQLRGSAKGKPGFEGVTAADADKFLYGEDGLPA